MGLQEMFAGTPPCGGVSGFRSFNPSARHSEREHIKERSYFRPAFLSVSRGKGAFGNLHPDIRPSEKIQRMARWERGESWRRRYPSLLETLKINKDVRASDVDPKGKCDISEDGGLALGHETEGGSGFTQEVESVVEGLLLTQVTGSTYFHTYLLGRYVWNPMR